MKENPVALNDRVFLYPNPVSGCKPWRRLTHRKKEVTMKFLLAVLLIRFVAELVFRKDKTTDTVTTAGTSSKVFHPAEYELR